MVKLKVFVIIFSPKICGQHISVIQGVSPYRTKKWKYIRYYKNENLSATEKIKHLKSFGLSPNNVYKTDMTDVLMYRIFVDAGLNGENAEYEELYDLENDPKETTNLANDKKYKDILENLRTEWFKALKLARGNGKPMVDIICDGYSIPK